MFFCIFQHDAVSAFSVGRLAQLGEHLVYTERVGGSIPSPPTIPLSVPIGN